VTPLATAGALICFAANSLLCRLALAAGHVDAASFTTLRLASGAAMLAVLARGGYRGSGSWLSAGALLLYAAPFSFAYLRLDAGVGALVLFVAVQVTMIGGGVIGGERPRRMAWAGLLLALSGLVGLTLPGATGYDPAGVALMAVAGVAWGVYSLRGRSAGRPLHATAANFARSAPLSLGLSLVQLTLLETGFAVSGRGALLAVASGALASALGYVIWYVALARLTATLAAMLQLLVPVLAAAGGVGLLGEVVSARLLLSGGAILVGVALAILGR
jgi:drug/metabolite transporter (DMT)-like permease